VDFFGRWPEFAARVELEPELAGSMVAGSPNKSLEGDDTLRALAARARGAASVSRALTLPIDAAMAALAVDDEAAQFRAGLAGYLEQFGRRSDHFQDVSHASWREDAAPVIALVRMYLREQGADVQATRERLLRERDRTVDVARSEIGSRSQELLEEFDRELAFGRRAVALNEDHNFWIDQQAYYWMRMDLLAAGRLLATAGVIDARDDCFLLTLDELRAALQGGIPTLRDVVAGRRRDLDHWKTVTPPNALGVELPAQAIAAMAPMFGGVFGGVEESVVTGQSASRGVATGHARIIRTLAEADRLVPGEILVAVTTSPPWTPLFGVASAIVTDAGGALSHAAIVAREYGIPAVVGTVNATARIRDGQLIRVDGSSGTVELLETS
jgi:pyruvate,water dikinase